MRTSYLVLRRLTGSDLGWFAGPRDAGRAKGRQRGINFNSREMEKIFSPEALGAGDIPVNSTRRSDEQTQLRRIRLQEKNWRLVGDKVVGADLGALEEGDFFWAEIDTQSGEPYTVLWDVVMKATDPSLHQRLESEFSVFIEGGMASWSGSEPEAKYLAELVGAREPDAPHAAPSRVSENAPTKPSPTSRRSDTEAGATAGEPIVKRPKLKRIEDRLQRPHILTEILKSGLVLSASAQAKFIDVLDTLAAELRDQLKRASLVSMVEINHPKAWAAFKGRRIGFVDGGMANVAALGAAPVAIRVGSYVVTPGDDGPDREKFDFEIQLVDDLYEASGTRPGIYEDLFEDVAKLRDAARISCEIGGMLALSGREPPLDIILLHGPLVNPVSPYALGEPGRDGAFPNFTGETIAKLLPGREKASGRDANFISIYREQLKRLESGSPTICGVVERPSSATPGPLIRAILERLQEEGRIDAATRREFLAKLEGYRITDSVMFECMLDEGEYITPMELDKQGPDHKIPAAWDSEIRSYPKPFTTYVKSNTETMPVRAEFFQTGKLDHKGLMSLIVHTSRLLPKYSFPVGLDIVDKHAKVPEWMSKQMHVMLSTQLMRKAMDSGSPAAIRVVRRILSANVRDWLFRPDFRKGSN